MARKIRLTRPELKRYRDARARYERYLPMLKLKQQQLQMAVHDATSRRVKAESALEAINTTIARYERVLADRAGISWERWTRPQTHITSVRNIAGVEISVLEDVTFPPRNTACLARPPGSIRRSPTCARDIGERPWSSRSGARKLCCGNRSRGSFNESICSSES